MVSEKGLKPYSKNDYPMLDNPKFIRFKFRKVGDLQYISHLDLQKTMGRVLIRAKAPLWYSKGFNPHPKLIFALPLSVGTQSECEYLDIRVERDVPPEVMLAHINAEVTDELRFLEAYYPEAPLEDIYFAEYDFEIISKSASPDLAEKIDEYLNADEVLISKKVKSKDKKISYKDVDIAPYVKRAEARFDGGKIKINAVLSASINQTHPHINPESLMKSIRERFSIVPDGDAGEEYSIMRRRVFFKDGETEFR